jgi:sodium-dependent dicarboxylate transporter 2/3/5
MKEESKKLLIFCLVIGGLILSTLLNPPAGLEPQGLLMLAIAVSAAILWVTEALPLGITGLLIILMQSLTGIVPLAKGLAYIANPVNAVVLVGYLLASSLVRSGMDRRISLNIIARMGERTDRLILGIMLAAAFMSMWMSNTATTAIMVPIAIGILTMAKAKPLESNLGKAMIIGIAFAANIGGMGTPTGTPANLITIALLDTLAGVKISFLGWMIRAMPLVILILPISWFVLIKVFPLEIKIVEGGLENVKKQIKEMGPMGTLEKKVVALFTTAIVLWLLDSFIPIMDDWLYIVAVLLTILIVLPKVGFMSWRDAQHEIGWDILFLVGGGLSMGAGLKATGVIEWIAGMLSGSLGMLDQGIALALVAGITGLGITIFCSLSGTASTFVPVAIGLALSFGWNPTAFGMVAGLAASFAFLFPANAAPNAVAYGAGYFRTMDMFKAGIIVMIFSVLILGALAGFIMTGIY